MSFAKQQSPGQQITCLVLAENIDPQQLLRLILHDQKHSGTPLSLAEKARFIEIASQFYDEDEIFILFGSQLSLDKKRPLFNCLKKLLKEEQYTIDSVDKGHIQEQMVMEIMRIRRHEDRLGIVRLFRYLQLGTGKQKRFFQLIRDGAHVEGVPISEYLTHPEMVQILDADHLNVPQKIKHLSDFLVQQTQPGYLKAEQQFGERVKELNIPRNMTITHVPFFEKDNVTLSITFENFEACVSYLAKEKKV